MLYFTIKYKTKKKYAKGREKGTKVKKRSKIRYWHIDIISQLKCSVTIIKASIDTFGHIALLVKL